MKVKRLVIDLKRNTMQTTRKEVRLTELHVLARIYGMSDVKVLGFLDAPAEDINPFAEYTRLMQVYGDDAYKTYGEYIDGRIQETLNNGYAVFGDLGVFVPEVVIDDPLATKAEPPKEQKDPVGIDIEPQPLESKTDIMKALKRLGIKFNDHTKKAALMEQLVTDVPLQFRALNEVPISAKLDSQLTELYDMRGI